MALHTWGWELNPRHNQPDKEPDMDPIDRLMAAADAALTAWEDVDPVTVDGDVLADVKKELRG